MLDRLTDLVGHADQQVEFLRQRSDVGVNAKRTTDEKLAVIFGLTLGEKTGILGMVIFHESAHKVRGGGENSRNDNIFTHFSPSNPPNLTYHPLNGRKIFGKKSNDYAKSYRYFATVMLDFEAIRFGSYSIPG